MIEELKMVLDSIGDLTGVALWVVGFFILFKIIIYMSTTGAFIYCFKLGVIKMHDYMTGPKEVTHNYRIQRVGDSSWLIDDNTRRLMEAVLEDVCTSEKGIRLTYIHLSDIEKLNTAWQEYKVNNKK